MISRQYRFKFFLNARHALEINGKWSSHPHTWELSLFLVKESEEFVQFTHLEEIISNHLHRYESKTLNDIEPFDELPPTMEIIGEVLFGQISELLSDGHWKITSLEISENSARSYSIKDTTYNFRGFNPLKAVKESKSISSNYLKNTLPKQLHVVQATKVLKATIADVVEINVDVDREKEVMIKNQEIELLKEQIVMLQEQFKLVNLKQDILNQQRHDLESKAETATTVEDDENDYIDNAAGKNEIPEVGLEKEEVQEQSLPTDLEEIMMNPEIESMDIQKGSRLLKAIVSIFNHIKKHQAYGVIALLLLSSLAIFFWITREGYNPWGSDTWGHIFKTHFLYKEVMKGNIFPQYTKLWYNGLQPFRYWAPFPYYVMLIGQLISGGNVLFGYYFFIGLVFFLGALPWVIYGKQKNHIYLGTVLGIMYFILPDNYRLLLAEGNLPRVVVSILFPYLLLCIFAYLEKRRNITLVFIYLMMMVITLTHAMIAALVGITVFVFVLVRFLIKKEKFIESIYILGSAIFGIISSAMWLYPALKGGIISLDSTGVSSVMENLTYEITQSLNPYFRFTGSMSDKYYFGVAIFVILIIGLMISKGKAKASFVVVFIIFLGTTKWFLFALKKLPMSELFWMMRFTPMAMALFLFALLDWQELKQKVLYIFIGALLLDSLITMNVVNSSLPIHRANESVTYASSIATQRVAMMDLSTYDSDPSFHISYGTEGREVSQVFGWAWQGATTATNIVEINDAYQKGYYKFMFDRLLELGSDTVIVRKAYIEDKTRLFEAANQVGFKFEKEFGDDWVFRYYVNHEFATKVTYPYLALGKYSSNVLLAFPQFRTDKEVYIDRYDMDYLMSFKKIVLSGFKYDNKKRAEEMIRELAKNGVEVYIDLAGQEDDMYSMRAEFLDVIAQPLNIKGSFPVLKMGEDQHVLQNFKLDSYEWNTLSLANLDEDIGVATIDHQEFSFYGKKYDKNIHFVGFNLFYYLYAQRDVAGLKLMGDILGIEPETLPKREVVEVKFKVDRNHIEINAEAGTLMPMAKLDAFESKQSIGEVNNLSLLVEGNTNIEVIYPYARKGGIIALGGLILFVICLLIKEQVENFFYKIYQRIIEGNYEKNN